MSEIYVRPALPAVTFTDAGGRAIQYGLRWGSAGAPQEAHGRVGNPERFAALHDLADAIVAFLLENYDCALETGPGVVPPRRKGLASGVRTVRTVKLTPASRHAAPLVIEYLDFPSVDVHAGLLHDFVVPDCGCDACDETLESSADELEWLVFAVVGGGFTEWFTGRVRPTLHMSLSWDDGHRGASGPLRFSALPNDRIREARKQLASLPQGWQPWPRRAGSPGAN